jgi:hypothetical protein
LPGNTFPEAKGFAPGRQRRIVGRVRLGRIIDYRMAHLAVIEPLQRLPSLDHHRVRLIHRHVVVHPDYRRGALNPRGNHRARRVVTAIRGGVGRRIRKGAGRAQMNQRDDHNAEREPRQRRANPGSPFGVGDKFHDDET